MGKGSSRFVLILQMLVGLILSAMIAHLFVIIYEQNRIWELDRTIQLGAYLLIIIVSFAIQIILRVKHRSHTPEAELLPFLLLFMTLECTMVLPVYFQETGILIFDTNVTNIIIRFSLVGTAMTFVYTALLHMGSHISAGNITTSIIALLLLSILAPSSSSMQAAEYGFGSTYDVYFNFATILLYVAASVTFIIGAFNEKIPHTIIRSITYILMLLGNWGIVADNSYLMTVISAVIYIVSSILLIITSKDAF